LVEVGTAGALSQARGPLFILRPLQNRVMTIRETAFYRITLFLSLITICIIQVDRPLALFIHNHLAALQQPFTKILSVLEFSDFTISRYIVAAIILGAALYLLLRDKTAQRAKYLFFIVATMISTRLVVRLLKSLFDRNRPHAFLNDRSVGDFFCPEADSFPSGHAANYFSFFLPLIALFPRYKWPLLILPILVALQRIIVNDHYLSDVLAGILIASLITLLFQRIFKIESASLFLPPNKTI
jgi:membrane-associated phospholipid phosphatase